jgi:hypothetical protein
MRGVNIGRVLRFQIKDAAVAVQPEIEGVRVRTPVELKSSRLFKGMVAKWFRAPPSSDSAAATHLAGSSEGHGAVAANHEPGQRPWVAWTPARRTWSAGPWPNAELKQLLETLSGRSEQRTRRGLTASLKRSAEGLRRRRRAGADRIVKRLVRWPKADSVARPRPFLEVWRVCWGGSTAERHVGAGRRAAVQPDRLPPPVNQTSVTSPFGDDIKNPRKYLKIGVFCCARSALRPPLAGLGESRLLALA